MLCENRGDFIVILILLYYIKCLRLDYIKLNGIRLLYNVLNGLDWTGLDVETLLFSAGVWDSKAGPGEADS